MVEKSSNKRKHDAVLAAALFYYDDHDDKEKLGIHKKRNISPSLSVASSSSSSFQQQHAAGGVDPLHQQHPPEVRQYFGTDTVLQELIDLRDIRRQVLQLQSRQQQQQYQQLMVSRWFLRALQSMQRCPRVAVVQCLGLHVLRQLVQCWGCLEKGHTTTTTSTTTITSTPQPPPQLLLLLPSGGQGLVEILWEATLQRTLSDPVLQRDVAVQRAATALTASCWSETPSTPLHHHFEINTDYGSMITALTQILQFHADDPVIQCNATATLCHLTVVVHQLHQSPLTDRHDVTIEERHPLRPDKDMFENTHKSPRALEIHINDPNDLYVNKDNTVNATLRQLPLILYECMERHGKDAAVFGNCVCLLTNLQKQQQQLDAPRPESPTGSLWLLPERIRQGMQQHTDSLPVQHASLRWLQLQLQVHSSHSNSGSNPRWMDWLLTVFPALVVSQAMERFPDSVPLQVCATQVLTLRILNRTEHKGHELIDNDDDTSHAAVWQALRRHPQALQLPSAAYFVVQHTTTKTTAAATRAFGGDTDHPWTVLQYVWQRLGLLLSSTTAESSSLSEPSDAAAAAAMDRPEDEAPAVSSSMEQEHSQS